MKVGDTVVLSGLVKTKHLNGKLASIVKKHDGDRWIVHLDGEDDVEVRTWFHLVEASCIMDFTSRRSQLERTV